MKIQVTSPQVVNQAASADVIPHLLSHNHQMPSLCNPTRLARIKKRGKSWEVSPGYPFNMTDRHEALLVPLFYCDFKV